MKKLIFLILTLSSLHANGETTESIGIGYGLGYGGGLGANYTIIKDSQSYYVAGGLLAYTSLGGIILSYWVWSWLDS